MAQHPAPARPRNRLRVCVAVCAAGCEDHVVVEFVPVSGEGPAVADAFGPPIAVHGEADRVDHHEGGPLRSLVDEPAVQADDGLAVGFGR